ncbi:DUF3043 domain-containing protein [Dietzia timorensis]|uniref:DUF3043 domain-containing protein n=1 Tax=Dietzia timorensis TaxID=499555 RepID=A0A173LJP9_9ACTN|nr:DUF3043 domain-containing protein [Dietzia timorensis]ANI92123.1 Uncharacterized protein BJL86_1341 [Dietzia timorensis]
MKFGFGSKSKSASEQSESSDLALDQDAVEAESSAEAAAEKRRGSATTPKKGRPTPTRREAERARGQRTGPVAAPLTRKEAKERRKNEKNSMSKEERKIARARANAAREERRQAMLDGDDRYVLERDRGPQRRYARDWVDTHRRISNYFMPVALLIIVFQFFPIPGLIGIFQIAFLLVILIVIIDTILVGRTVNRAVAERFGDDAKTGFGLGFYAAMRAMQPKSLRTPRPRVKPGDAIPGT